MRLFVAVWPPRPVVAGLRRLERPARPGVRWTTEDQWHVTLRFLGEVPTEEAEEGKGALVRLDRLGSTTPVVAHAGPALTRLGESIWCIPVSGLDDLAAAVGEVTAGIGQPAPARPFRGHLTVARLKRGARPPAEPSPFSARWPVSEVTLVASTLHPTGARYEVLSRVALSPT